MRRQVLDHHKGRVDVGNVPEEFLNGLQSSCRSANPDDEAPLGFLILLPLSSPLLFGFMIYRICGLIRRGRFRIFQFLRIRV
jgi:hypothetical protein